MNDPYIDPELQDILDDLEDSGKDKPEPAPKPKEEPKQEPEQKQELKENKNPSGPTLVSKRAVEASIVEDEEESEVVEEDPEVSKMRDKALVVIDNLLAECDQDRKQTDEVIEMFIDMVREGGEEDGRPSKPAVDGLASALNTKIQNSSVKSRAIDSLTKLITATKKKTATSIREQNNYVSGAELKELLDGKKNK